MKRKIFPAISLLLSGIPTWGAPRLVLSPGTLSFGRYPANLVQKQRVQLFNRGDEPLKIGKVQSTCGCAAAVPGQNELPPGKSTVLEITLPAEGISGIFSKNIYIHSNDPEHPIQPVTISGEAQPLFRVAPQALLYAGTLAAGQPWSQEFEVTATDPEIKWGTPELSPTGAKIDCVWHELAPLHFALRITIIPEKIAEQVQYVLKIPVLSPRGWKPLEITIHARVIP